MTLEMMETRGYSFSSLVRAPSAPCSGGRGAASSPNRRPNRINPLSSRSWPLNNKTRWSRNARRMVAAPSSSSLRTSHSTSAPRGAENGLILIRLDFGIAVAVVGGGMLEALIVAMLSSFLYISSGLVYNYGRASRYKAGFDPLMKGFHLCEWAGLGHNRPQLSAGDDFQALANFISRHVTAS